MDLTWHLAQQGCDGSLGPDAHRQGWVVRAINYPSITTDLADHAQQLQALMQQAPTAGRRVVLTIPWVGWWCAP